MGTLGRLRSLAVIWLFGACSAPAWADIVISPGPSLDMGVAPPGQILEAKLTIQNTGATRMFGEVQIFGGQFWLHRTTCTLAMGLEPGQSCEALVRFSAATVCSGYWSDLIVFDWSNRQPLASIELTASGGVGAPPCPVSTDSSRWTRVLGTYPESGTYAGTFATVADLGHDGEMDAILVLMPGTVDPADWYTEKLTKVRVYTYTAAGQFIDTTSRWFGVAPLMMPNLSSPVVADFNGDGKDDIAFACNNEDGRPEYDQGNVTHLWYTHQYVWLSGPTDAYTVQALSPQVEYGAFLDGADIDKDGDVDLLVSGTREVPGQPGEVGMYLLLNNGQGSFSFGQIIPLATPSHAYRNLAWPRFADLDADGDPDLLVGRARDGGVALMRNDSGIFVYQKDIEVFPGSYDAGDGFWHIDLGFDTGSTEGANDIRVVDMDGDGVLDFVAYAGGSLDHQPFLAQFSMVRVVRGLGGLNFQAQGGPFDLVQLGPTLYEQVLSLNGDNAPDVFLRQQSRYEGRVHFKQLRNLGDGRLRFENMLAFPVNDPFPDSVHIADMNHDGRPDLLFTHDGPFGPPGEQVPGLRGVAINMMPERMDRPLQSLSVGDVSISEGNAGTKQANFTVTLSQPAPTPVSFDAYTAPGTATPGVDYQSHAVIGQSIAAGATSGNIAVTIQGDTQVEGHETFTVNLANALDASIADGQALGRISNDDLAQLSIADASLAEGNSGASTMRFVVTLSQPMPNPVTFDIATSNGTASAGSDYQARSLGGRLLDAGRTRWEFEVAINGDASVEPDETFTVTLSNVGGATLGDGTATGTIVNDDAAALRGLRRPTSAATPAGPRRTRERANRP